MYSSSEIETSIKGTYSALDQTYCGKGIPKIPYETFNPPLPVERQGQPSSCSADWNVYQVPSMSTQIVLNSFQYPHYTALTHNSPYTSSGYFSFQPAYGNGQYGYEPLFRSCDGTLYKKKD